MDEQDFEKRFSELLSFYDCCWNLIEAKSRATKGQMQAAWYREFEEFIVECDDVQADRALRIYLFHIRGGHKKDVQQLHG